MDQERIGILLAKLLAGEATLPEQKELEMAFRDDPSLRETWDALRALKETPPTGVSVGEGRRARRVQAHIVSAHRIVGGARVRQDNAPAGVAGKHVPVRRGGSADLEEQISHRRR